MAEVGARVAVCLGEDRQPALELAQRIVAGGGEAFDCPCDTGDEAQVGDLFRRVADRFGGVDVLVAESGRRGAQGLRGLHPGRLGVGGSDQPHRDLSLCA